MRRIHSVTGSWALVLVFTVAPLAMFAENQDAPPRNEKKMHDNLVKEVRQGTAYLADGRSVASRGVSRVVR